MRKLRERYDAARFEFYTPDEVRALADAAASAQDAALYLTAAFPGLRRGELVALRWGEVDFQNHVIRVVEGYSRSRRGRPKSRRSRSVPMVAEVARALTDLKRRERFTARDDLVFCAEDGGQIDGSELRRRFVLAREAAGLRALRFHDLRHTFGSLAISRASIVQVQGLDGPRPHQDHDALPTPQKPRRRSRNPGRGVRRPVSQQERRDSGSGLCRSWH